MPSKFCPDCGGFGSVICYGFMVSCNLCKANQIGNSHLLIKDFVNPMYMASWMLGESSPDYWSWLRKMVDSKQIDPNQKTETKIKTKKRRGQK